MRGSGALSQKLTPLPIRQPQKRQSQRKYYTMRFDFFQGLHDKKSRRTHEKLFQAEPNPLKI